LKKKGFKEESMTKVRLYALGTSTTLESNKSVFGKHREKSPMRGITVRATLVMVALIAALYLPTQRTGAQEPAKFDLAKAITGAKTPAEHEAIASYYDKEAAIAKDKAAEHRRLAQIYRSLSVSSRVQLPPMENHTFHRI